MEFSKSLASNRLLLTVRGIVQGVGFRPFVFRTAKRFGIKGFVCNTSDGVVIDAQGIDLDGFVEALKADAPERSRIDRIETVMCQPGEYIGFEIRSSSEGKSGVAIPLDSALCPTCQTEMDDPHNLRYRYPFINCTDCGPRYTIIQAPPYDRIRTSMRDFEMCVECEAEYTDPTSRRYHAEPISCPKCGPRLTFCDNKGIETEGDPLDLAVAMLKAGKIIALKGVGGFHLMCDATSDKAVQELRRRKHRKTKPLAVMCGSLEQLETYAYINDDEKALILGAVKPIVIVDAKMGTNLSLQVAPKIKRIGVFLPYTPLHRLIFEAIDFPLIATSANISDEPIIIRCEEIVRQLGNVVDGILDHNRTIVNALDDAVVQIADGRVVMLRMGRGYAPFSLSLDIPIRNPILAVGGHQKSAVAIAVSYNMILGGHIGDLGSVEADGYFERSVDTLKRFYDTRPSVILHDKHPFYSSTRYAQEQKKEHYAIGHHYAHILACMAEYGLSQKVLGFAFDGTGYGEDGTLWGGEVMIADVHSFERIGHLKSFALIGGDKAIKEPRRIALSLLFEQYTLDEVLALKIPTTEAFLPHEIRQLHQVWLKKLNSPQSSSIGRLFDAVASLGGFIQSLDYEGQGGMIMEGFVDEKISEPFAFDADAGVIDISPMIAQIIALISHENAKVLIASRFIATVEAMIGYFADLYPGLPIVVGGGVFQNRILMERLYRCFSDHPFYAQQHTPLNDGGIALGQAWWGIFNTQSDIIKVTRS